MSEIPSQSAMEILEVRECPECGAQELPGLPNDCYQHPEITEFVTRRYGLVPIDGERGTTA